MHLLAPDIRRIGRPASEPYPDRAPESVAAGTPEPLRSDLVALLGPERVLTRPIDLIRYASDASPYRLIPRVVVMAHDTGDVAKVFGYARRTRTPVVLRGGGTSLNGQGQTDGILVDVRRHWRGIEVLDGGDRARVRPGTVLGYANRVLAEYGSRLGPDPASTDIATIGGVIANNSGGMRCGVTEDSYSTVRSLSFVLPSGTVIDTAEPHAEDDFTRHEPELARGVEAIRDEIRADPELADRIRHKFEIKNTMGFRLCAFLDADTPLEIFRRLLVGSEGTLAFIAEAVFDCVREGEHRTTALLSFPDLDTAAAAVPGLVEIGARAVELVLPAMFLLARNAFPGMPEEWDALNPEAGLLLVELRTDEQQKLDGLEEAAASVLADKQLLEPATWTRDPELTEKYWHVREGMFGLFGKMRPAGTALITEDVCVPPERIGECAEDLRALLGKHGFIPGVAGHASAGNLHFTLTPAFEQESERERYDAFMGELVELIVGKYDGSLKAEHGTGLNMAPFLEREWGTKAVELMWRVKQLADPDGILGPDVMLNRDPAVHLQNLKTQPPIEDAGEATACVECGFCEPVCPSRNLTTTPRQRIVVRREMARQPVGSPLFDALLEDYEYDAIETCAADGTCRLACPVGIDTGKLVKEFRTRQSSERGEKTALALAKRWATVERAARAGLRAGHATRGVAPRGATELLRRAISHELVPTWPESMPKPAPARMPETQRQAAVAVYLPACVNRIFGASPAIGSAARANGGAPRARASAPTVVEALVAISARAGKPVWIPPDAPGHCCGTPWTSKGHPRGQAFMANKTVEALWRWTAGGRLPVVVDASSCTGALHDEVPGALSDERSERHRRLDILDSVDWLHDHVLPQLDIARARSVAVHPTCSTRHMDATVKLQRVAEVLAEDVYIPPSAFCCGFAGDRGMLHPELTASATQAEAAELAGRSFDAYVSTNRTCEIGMQQGTGSPYVSIVQLAEERSRSG
jgi:D-lactate dehydrogenase